MNHLIYDCPQMFLTCWSFSDLFMKEPLFSLHRLMIRLQSKSSTCAWSRLKVKYRLHRLISWKEWMAYLAGKSSKMSKQSTAIISSSLWTNSWYLFVHRLFPSQPSSTVTQRAFKKTLEFLERSTLSPVYRIFRALVRMCEIKNTELLISAPGFSFIFK